METIVVGVDGSETAKQAAEVAVDLAAAKGARLVVVSAVEKNESAVIDGGGSDRWMISTVDNAKSTAEEVAAKLRAVSPSVTISVGVGVGKPANVLIEQAEESGASLIVVGNRRMQGPGRLLGSIPNSVAHHAPCDVYIVKTT